MRNIIFTLVAVTLILTPKANCNERFRLDRVMSRLHDLSYNLANTVTSYQRYVYDSNRYPMNYIIDGGNDLFDDGNKARFIEDRMGRRLEYNATISTERFNVSTLAINPFIALAAIVNAEGEFHTYTFRVNGDLGADGRGDIVTHEGRIGDGSGVLTYHSFQVHQSGDPSLCEVYFTITSPEFDSVPPTRFRVIRFSTSTRATSNAVRVIGMPQNVYFGYVLLARTDSQLIPDEEVQAVMRIILQATDPNVRSTTLTPQTTKSIPTHGVVTDEEITKEPQEPLIAITLEELVSGFERASANITDTIENFYYYNYDTFRSPMNAIRDGGNDMYDSGNQVKFVEDNEMQHLMYNVSVTTERYDVTTRSIHPFLTLALIRNHDEEEHTYSIRVTGNIGADGEGNISQSSGKLSDGNAFLKFYAFQLHNSGDPTICEVYFTISNSDWGSVVADRFSVVMFSNSKRFLNNEVKLSGRPKNVVFGYTLFSKARSEFITDAEIISAMKIILRSTLANNFDGERQSITTVSLPVTATTMPAVTEISLNNLWKKANRVQQSVASIFPSFFYYDYDDLLPPNNSIEDGGNDMFDGGNMIKVFTEAFQPIEPLDYNSQHSFPTYDVRVGGNGHPFMTLAWIRNEEGARSSYSIKVEGNLGTDGAGHYITDRGSFDNENGFVRYSIFQVFGARDPSVCELYFVITREEWESSADTEFEMIESAMMTNQISTTVRLSGTPQNILMGYALLSRENGEEVEIKSIHEFLRQLLEHIASDTVEITVDPTFSATTVTEQTISQSTRTETPTTTSSSTIPTEPIVETEEPEIVIPDTESPFEGISQLRQTFDIIEQNRGRLSQSYPDWYTYTYDGENGISIEDGGEDIFDTGNFIRIFENGLGKIEDAVYNTTYEFDNFHFQSVAKDPFIAMLWVKNNFFNPLSYTIQVLGVPGAGGRGLITKQDGTVMVGNLKIEYKSFQIHGAGDANICEVYFVISDYNETMSNRPDSFELVTTMSDLSFVNNSAIISGTPFNILFGYTVLSRFPSTLIGRLDIESFLITAFDVAPRAREISPVLTSTIENIAVRNAAIMWSYANWYTYLYDGNAMTITDGGRDMLDGGNIVEVFENGRRTINVIYDQAYSFDNFDFQTDTGNPFVALLWIKNEQLRLLSYSIQVRGNPGADGSGSINSYDGILIFGNTYIEYRVFQISGTEDASICELYFAVQNLSDVQANAYDTFDFVQFSDDTVSTNNTITVAGRPSRILLGYMLLSRYPSSLITSDEIQRVLQSAFDLEFHPTIPISTTPSITTTQEVIEESTPEATTTQSPEITTTATTTSAEPTVTRNTRTSASTTISTPPTTGPTTEISTATYSLTTTTSTEQSTSSVVTAEVTTDTDLSTISPRITSPAVIRPRDLDFLPSCTVKGTVLALFRCERLFMERTIYTGPATCRAKIDEAIRCVGNQLVECRFGGGRNVLDSHNLPLFNSKTMISMLYNLTTEALQSPNYEINAFCYVAGFNAAYPHPVMGNLPGCETGVIDVLLERVKTLYYGYIWSRNKTDLCRAFRSFKMWFLFNASTQCNFETLLSEIYPPSTAQYLSEVSRIFIETVSELSISACSESSDVFTLDRPGLFLKPSLSSCEAS